MKGVRRAVIDIGTNSVKLLVAEVEGAEVRPVWEESSQTRLGQGLYTMQRLQPGPIAKTAAAVAEFAARARDREAASIRVIATSAARDASNSQELTAAIERVSGLRVEIVSGKREADWVFQGVTTAPALAALPLLLLDVGGGSTEFIVGQGGRKHFGRSFQLGTVRLLEQFPPRDPPAAGELAACRRWLAAFLEKEVQPCLAPVLRQEAAAGQLHLAGVGGTATILACMEAQLRTFDRQRIEETRLSAERLTWYADRLWGLPLGERERLPGLPKNRADVVLMGVAIYEAVMRQFHLEELRVSTRGLRFAAVMSAPV
jgi:exopolyphosphatase/guanosine-5'-triphosphate,3'-diphosphate pyrophosphatase